MLFRSDAERKTTTVLYRDRPSIAAGATLAQVKANAVVTGFNAARDRVSTIERDAAARTVRVYDALTLTSATPSESYQYDAVGNRISSTDARGNTTYRTFDAVGRELTLTDALGFVTTQGYDALGNLTKLTDARGDRKSTRLNSSHCALSRMPSSA